MNAAKLAGPEPFYCDARVTLFNARFEDVLPQLAADSFDALITDPPYATTNIAWDQPVKWPVFWPDAIRICRPHAPMVFFASGKFVPVLIGSNPAYYKYDLIWEKNLPVGHLDANRRPLRSHESILVFAKQFRGSRYNPQKTVGKVHTIGKGNKPQHYGTSSRNVVERTTDLWHPRSVLKFNNARARSLHPTQKPLDLMKWLVSTYSDRGDLILEPFAGSGSTVLAAVELGRRVIAIEQDLGYYETIVRRISGRE